MLIAVHAWYPDMVFATHDESQLEEILVAYPESEYGIGRTQTPCEGNDPLPADVEWIRAVPPPIWPEA